jgi:hypothetical protein
MSEVRSIHNLPLNERSILHLLRSIYLLRSRIEHNTIVVTKQTLPHGDVWSVINSASVSIRDVHRGHQAALRALIILIGELANLTTKIITLWEISFAVRVIKWLMMHLEIFGGKRVSSMKKCIFISLEKCFCTFFCEFFEVIFDCTCALADQSRNAGIVYEQYCLCPGWPCARKSFNKVVYVSEFGLPEASIPRNLRRGSKRHATTLEPI